MKYLHVVSGYPEFTERSMALKLRKSGAGKGKRQVLLLQSLLRSELGNKTNNTSAATKDALDDPYEFVNSQSLEPNSPQTPKSFLKKPSTTPKTEKTPRKSPSGHSAKKSPAEIREERLQKREEEDLKRALEESKKEAAREERRRRWQNRKKEEQEEEEVIERVKDRENSSGHSEEAERKRRDDNEEVVEQGKDTPNSSRHSEKVVITSSTAGYSNEPEVTEFNNGWGQSTPPLSGVLHQTQSTPILRTPRVYVTKLSSNITPDRRDSWDSTPKLSEVNEEERKEGGGAYGTGEGAEGVGGGGGGGGGGGDGEKESAENGVVINQRDSEEEKLSPVSPAGTETENNEKKCLSLKRGRKRNLMISQTTPPYFKKQRMNQEVVNGHSHDNHVTSIPTTSSVPTETITKQCDTLPIIETQRNKPPDMFAPANCLSLSSCTAAILNVFNSYIHQLREAQSNVIFHVPWGKPVLASSRQSRSSLSWPRVCRSSLRSLPPTPPPHHLPAIDLATGEVIRYSPSRSGSVTRRYSQRGVKNLSFFEDEDCMDEDRTPSTSSGKKQSITPIRPHPPLSSTRDSVRKTRKWFVPAALPHKKIPLCDNHTISVPAHSTTPDPPPPPSPPPLPFPSSSVQDPICSVKSNISTTDVTVNDKVENKTNESVKEVSLVPLSDGDSISSTRVGDRETQCASNYQRGKEEERMAISETGGEGGEGGEGGMNHLSRETDEEERGVAVTGTPSNLSGRRRKRARILDDSDSDFEWDSKDSNSDVIPAKNRHSIAGNRCSKTTPAKNRDKKSSLIDLTEVKEVEEEEEMEVMVSCPLCSKHLPISVIETHAAECAPEDDTKQIKRVPSPRLSLRQSLLLTPQFRKPNTAPPQPLEASPPQFTHGSALEDEIEEEEEEGEEEEEQVVEERSTAGDGGGPIVRECEGGGYQVDPSSISSSPIRSFRRITELDPKERDDYYNQFSGRRGRGHCHGYERSENTPGSSNTNLRKGRGQAGRKRGGRGGRKFFWGRFRGQGSWRGRRNFSK